MKNNRPGDPLAQDHPATIHCTCIYTAYLVVLAYQLSETDVYKDDNQNGLHKKFSNPLMPTGGISQL